MVDRVLRIVVEGQDRSGGRTIQNLNKDLGGLLSVGTRLGTMAGIAKTAKELYDLGKAGAGIERLRTAGEQLADSMGSDFDSIQGAIREASLGTVSDLDIMAAANRAMMLGISADADQLGELMQVAALRGRAMGLDTTQAFSDIVTGIGRMSPLILDNLGIVIDAEKRYKEYAEAVGISSDEIDGAMKRQILLNGVLEEGRRQLQAAGGLALDNAGKIERMEASMKNAADAAKERLAPSVAAVADGLYWLLTVQDQLNAAFDEHAKEVLDTSKSYEEYVAETIRAAELTKQLTGDEARLYQQFLLTHGSMEALNEMTLQEAMYYERLAEQTGILTQAQFEAYQVALLLGDERRENIEQLQIYQEGTQAAAVATEVLEARLESLKELIAGEIGDEYDKFIERNTDLKEEAEGLKQKIAELEGRKYLTEAQKEELANARIELDKVTEAIKANEQQHTESTLKILFNMAEQRLAIDGFTEEELGLLTGLAYRWGLIDENTATAAEGMANALGKFAESGDVTAALDALDDVARAANGIPRDIVIRIRTDIRGMGRTVDPIGGNIPEHASGGPGWQGAPIWVGEEGPEPFVPFMSGVVIPNWRVNESRGAMEPGGGGISVAFYNTKIDSEMDLEMVAYRVARVIQERQGL